MAKCSAATLARSDRVRRRRRSPARIARDRIVREGRTGQMLASALCGHTAYRRSGAHEKIQAVQTGRKLTAARTHHPPFARSVSPPKTQGAHNNVLPGLPARARSNCDTTDQAPTLRLLLRACYQPPCTTSPSPMYAPTRRPALPSVCVPQRRARAAKHLTRHRHPAMMRMRARLHRRPSQLRRFVGHRYRQPAAPPHHLRRRRHRGHRLLVASLQPHGTSSSLA